MLNSTFASDVIEIKRGHGWGRGGGHRAYGWSRAERSAGMEEAALRDFGNRVAVKNAVHKFAPYLSD
jgi:hypothetical protein